MFSNLIYFMFALTDLRMNLSICVDRMSAKSTMEGVSRLVVSIVNE